MPAGHGDRSSVNLPQTISCVTALASPKKVLANRKATADNSGLEIRVFNLSLTQRGEAMRKRWLSGGWVAALVLIPAAPLHAEPVRLPDGKTLSKVDFDRHV